MVLINPASQKDDTKQQPAPEVQTPAVPLGQPPDARDITDNRGDCAA